MSDKIQAVHAHEILDSRGNPTVSVSVLLSDGKSAHASVPSGASTGIHEALELRDGDHHRYRGQGVTKAVRNVNTKIAASLRGMKVHNQRQIDETMIMLDGTVNKKKLGANAILGVSLACAHAAAKNKRMPLYAYLRWTYDLKYKNYKLPTPLMNVLNGGVHADNSLDMQEFMIIPHAFKSFTRKTQAGSEIFHALGDILHQKKLNTAVGNEGGYAPNMRRNEQALELVMQAIKKAGYKPGQEVSIGLDIAASEFYNEDKNRYELKTDRRKVNAADLIELVADWAKRYPLISVEDGLDQDAWEDWQIMTKLLGKKMMLVGDDLFVTQVDRLQRGIDQKAANAILIKLNQVGSLSETIDTILLAQQNKYKVVVSHRSGETCDTTIADLAVAVNAEYIKTGSLSRSERLAKYNRLLEIEEEL
ncbi:MAG: phosphopyruvate hydratase [Candidatus Uhrbacteria bacterium]